MVGIPTTPASGFAPFQRRKDAAYFPNPADSPRGGPDRHNFPCGTDRKLSSKTSSHLSGCSALYGGPWRLLPWGPIPSLTPGFAWQMTSAAANPLVPAPEGGKNKARFVAGCPLPGAAASGTPSGTRGDAPGRQPCNVFQARTLHTAARPPPCVP